VEIVVDAKVTGSPEGLPLRGWATKSGKEGEREREKSDGKSRARAREREREGRIGKRTDRGGRGWVNPATCLANRAYVVQPVRRAYATPAFSQLDDVLQLYGRFGIRFYCYRIKRPSERPLNIDGPARTIREEEGETP